MATDTTNVQSETANAGSVVHEGDVEQVNVTQSGNAPTPIQVPQGANVVRVQVTPGETVELPFPTDGLVARLGDNGNLAVKVGDVTVILLGYAEATGQGEITIIGNDARPVDVAAVLASTDPNLDIQTAAGPGAGDQGAGVDNNGGVFSPFDPNAGIGGLNAVGGLQATNLNYVEILREFPELIENDEIDTSPVVISITKPNAVNEDDLTGGRGNDQAAKEIEDFPSHVLDGLNDVPGIGNAYWGGPLETGNDPFDTDDHEDGSQLPGHSDDVNGVDQDLEPTTVTAVVSINFFGDTPGHLSFINGGNTPIIDQLTAMNLTSHSNELQYVILPGAPDTNPDPNIDNSHGETLVAYYVNGGGEGDGYATVVFTISMREFESGDDFDVDFTIYGVIDNVPGTPDAAGDISDILDIGVPFFVVDSDGSVTPVPADALVFQDVDDTPSLGSLCYQWVNLDGEGEGGQWAWVPVEVKPTDSDIVHDETGGVQSGGQQWNDPDSDQEAQPEDDVNPNTYSWLRDEALNGAGLPLGTSLVGMAHSYLTVSFGADGRAYGNVEAGQTVFTGDAATNSQAFQIYIGSADAPLESGLTNWTITENGVVFEVLAEQTDANTIVGYALVGEGDAQTRIEVFVLHVQPNNGEVALLQLHQINQPDPTNSDDSTPALTIDGQDVNFRGTDYDGDHVDAPLTVIVQDDGPTICKTEYCSEGSFKHDKGYVDEDFLTAGTNGVPGHQDSDTNPDNLNNPASNGDGPGHTHVTGQIIADFGTDGPGGFSFNVLGLTVGGAGIDSGLKTAGGDAVFYKLVAAVDGVELQAYDPSNGDSAVFTVFLNHETGAFSFDLQAALYHKDNDGTATNDADDGDNGTARYEDDILIQLGVNVTDADGDIAPATLKFKVDDDAPKLICEPHTTSIENGECPVCQTEVSTALAEQDEQCLSEETCMVTITPGQQTPGWLHLEISVLDEEGNNNNNNGTQDALFQQNGLGYGVVSGEDGGSGGRFDEINYDHTANGNAGGSETLIFKIGTEACPQLALSATVELSRFYSNEGNVGNEQGHWEAWKGGVKVAEGDFTATNLNGQFGLAIPTVSGGFDELRFTAAPGTALPGGGFSDDSDYYVQNLNLEIKPTHLINGEFKYSFGADDGSVAPDGVAIEFTGGALTQGGKPVVLIETYDAQTGKTTFSAYVDGVDQGTEVTADDLPVFTLVLDPNASDANGVHTATYTFTQYGPLDNDGGMSDLPFKVTIEDRDHDAITTTIDVCVDDSAPETSNACATVFEKGLDQQGSAKDGTDENANSEFAHGFLNFSYNGDGPGSITSFALTSGPVPGVLATLANGVWTIDVPQFKITVDAVTGEYNFTLKQNFAHDDTADDGFDNREGVNPTVNVGDILKELGFSYTVEDGDHTQASGGLTVKVVDDGPIACVSNASADRLVLDETRPVGTDTDDGDSPSGRQTVSANFADNFSSDGGFTYGADGPGGVTYALTLTGSNVNSGLYALDPSDTVDGSDGIGQGNQIVLNKVGNDIVGTANGTEYFRISVDANGVVTFSQSNNIWHANTNDNDDSQTLTLSNANLLKIVQTLVDADGDHDSASINLGQGVFKIEDDGPTAIVKHGSTADTLTLDETRPLGTDTDGGAPNGLASVTANFADNFNSQAGFDYGSDGPGHVAYTLSLSSNGIGSGLYALDPSDTSDGQDGIGQGSQILLSKDGNDVVGKVGSTEYFRISVDEDTGQVTFSQSNNIWHSNTGSDDDSQTLTLSNASLLKIVQTLTDADGDTDSASINLGQGVFKIQDDGPDAIVKPGSVADILTLDETRPLGTDTDGGAPNGVASVTANFADNFNSAAGFDYGTDGPGSVAYALSVSANGIGSGLYALDASDKSAVDGDGIGQGSQIVLNKVGTDILGQVGGTTYFTISVDANGVVTFSQQKNIWHSDTGNDDDTSTLNTVTADKLKLTQTLTDADGDKDSASIDLGQGVFKIQDDGPDAIVKPESVADTLTLDESPLSPNGDGIHTVTANFADNFNSAAGFDYGSDGPGSVAYALSLTGTNVGSGLYALEPSDTVDGSDGIGQGDQIVLNKVGNDIVGSVGGTEYFRISVDANGVVTFSQSNNIWHSNTGSDDDSQTLTLSNANLLKIVQTLTDADGDKDTASIDLGQGVFKIQDDGPDAIVKPGSVADTLTLDETRPLGTDTDGSAPNGLASVTANFADNFNSVAGFDYGTDGPGSVAYALNLTGSNVQSGLFALQSSDKSAVDGDGIGQGSAILLNKVGNDIVGSVGGTEYFRISVDANGVVTFSQSNNIWHSDTGNDDDSQALTLSNANLLKIVQTLTDADGDKDSASIDLGQGVFKIQDDGPDAIVKPGSVADTLTLDESPLSPNGDGIHTVTANFADNFNSVAGFDYGTDGPGSVAYALNLTGSNVQSGLFALQPSDKSAGDGDGIGQGSEILLNKVGNDIVGSVGGTEYFRISVDANGVVTFSQSNNIWHSDTGNDDDSQTLTLSNANLLKIVQTLTDADGDADSASINLGQGVFKIQDDGPKASAKDGVSASTFVDESTGLGSGLDGINPATINAVTVAGLFNAPAGGTDGLGSITYKLSATDGAKTGLWLTGHSGAANEIVLVKISDTQYEGHEGTAAGTKAFTVSIDPATGAVTLTQSATLEHTTDGGPGAAHDDSLSLSAAAGIKVVQHVTDTDGDFSEATSANALGLSFQDDGPKASAVNGVTAGVILDESNGTGSGNDGINPGTISAAAISGLFNAPNGGADGLGTTTYKLSATDGAKTGLWLTGHSGAANEIVLVKISDTQYEGHEGNAAGTKAFTVSIDPATGAVTVTQAATLEHTVDGGPGAAHDDSLSLTGAAAISVVQQVTDKDGDYTDATSANALGISFQDDGPKASAKDGVSASVILDESNGTGSGNDGINPGTISAAAIQALFNAPNGGADGLDTTTYKLSATDGAKTGLWLTGHSGAANEIVLVKISDTQYEGHEGNAAGTKAFTVEIDPATGAVTVTQAATLEHTVDGGPGAAHDDSLSLTGAAAISVVQHVTDKDGDYTDATSANALGISFEDDGPKASAKTGIIMNFVLDESNGTGSGNDGVNPLTLNVASLFNTPAGGADGLGTTTYKLSATDGAKTGLWLTGHSGAANEIVLVKISDTQYEGHEGNAAGTKAFTVSIDPATGAVTVTQSATLEHTTDGGTAADHDDSLSLSAAAGIKVVQQVTDKDGDFSEATSANALGISFQDDGPKASAKDGVSASVILDESNGTGSGNDGINPGTISAAAISGLFNAPSGGADGLDTTTYKLSATDGAKTGLWLTGHSGAANEIVLVKISDTQYEGHEGNAAGTKAFTVSIDPATGAITVTQAATLAHTIPGAEHDDSLFLTGAAAINVVQHVTDKDGDYADATSANALSISFEDDGPKASAKDGVTASVILDESNGTGSGNDGINPGTISAATISSLFNAPAGGADGLGSTIYKLSATDGAKTGLWLTGHSGAANEIVLVKISDTQYEGHEGNVAGTKAFTVSIDPATGAVTVTQAATLEHTTDGGTVADHDDSLSLSAAAGIKVVQLVIDKDSDFSVATSANALSISFQDDGPKASAKDGVSASTFVDESTGLGSGVDGINPATINAATVAGLFNAPAGGADGLDTTTYKLSATDGAKTSLWLTGHSGAANEIVLVKISDTQYEGHEGTAAGTKAFTVSIDPATGAVTLTQSATLEHTTDGGPGAAHDDNLSLTGAAAISVVQHVTDKDGDFSEATSANALGLSFQDDGPKASAVNGVTASVILDESNGTGSGNDGINPNVINAAAVQALFNAPNGGADGLDSTSYKLSATDGAKTGMWLTGHSGAANEIILVKISDTKFEGHEGTAAGTKAFTVEIDPATGAVTVTQAATLEHTVDGGPGAAHDDSLSLTGAAAISVVQHVTDKDGDYTDATSANALGISFQDDGPKAVGEGTYVISSLVAGAEVSGNLLSNGDGFGADGGAISKITWNGTDYTPDVNGNIVINATGGQLVVKGSDGSWSFDQANYAGSATTHTFTYTLTDGDNDSDTATFNVALAVSKNPSFTVTDAKVDEDGLQLQTGEAASNGDDNQDSGDSGAGLGDPDGAGSRNSESIWQQQLVVDWGGPASGSFTLAVGSVDGNGFLKDSNGNLLKTISGDEIEVVATNGGKTLTGYADADVVGGVVAGGATPIFTIDITNGGLLTVNLLQPIQHPGHDNPDVAGTQTSFEDNLGFAITVTATNSNNQSTVHDFQVDVDDDTPTVTAGSDAGLTLTVDETILTTNATQSFAAAFTSEYGADGAGTVTYALSVTVGASGLIDTATNEAVNLVMNGSTVEGRTAISNLLVFTVVTDGSGNVTLDQIRAVVHPNSLNPDDSVTLGADSLVKLTATITDRDGDGTSSALNIGQNLIFKDDGPAISLSGTENTLTVDETFLAIDATQAFATAFTSSYGADAAGTTTYALAVTAGASGLIDTASNQAVVLSMNGGVVEGRTAISNELVFTVTVNSSGNVTLDQIRAVVHPTNNPDEPTSLNADTLVRLTATITDKDGDSTSATLNIGQNLVFKDDGPSIALSGTEATLTVDETILTTNATQAFASAFTSTYGADAAGTTTYALSATAGASGLVDTATNEAVNLVMNGSTVEGRTATTNLLVFTVVTDSSGNVTLDQIRAVVHPTTNPDESKTLSSDTLVKLTATITDKDGDTSNVALNIGQNLVFKDDGPSITLSGTENTLTVDETILATNATQAFASAFTPIYGADGAGTTTYALSVTAGASGLVDTATNEAVNLVMNGSTVEGRTATTNLLVFTVVTDSSGNVTLDQIRAVVHPTTNPDESKTLSSDTLVKLTATITDKDGDSAIATLNIGQNLVFKDDGPDAVDDNNAVVTTGTPITGNVTANDSSGADVKSSFPQGEVTKFTIDGIDYAANGAVHNIPGHGTMSMNATGSYAFTQTEGAAGTMNVTYTLKDADGDTDTAVLHIATVNDLAPINYNDANASNENVTQDTNIMVILDVSGSMADDADANTAGTQSRLEFCKAALIQLLNAYDALGEVKVTIVSFTTGAEIQLAWSSVAAAITEINTFNPQDYTNYQAAVETADDAWVAAGKIPGAQNVVYFLSDGNPTIGGDGSNHLTQSQKDTWDAFLENPANDIDHVYAVAVGDGIGGNEANPDSDLKDVADPDGNDSPDGQVLYVNDATALADRLVGTIANQPIAGNVLTGVDTSGVGDTGVLHTTPDAAGTGTTFVDSFVYDSANNAFDVTFSWNGVAANVTAIGGTNVVVNGHLVSFDTGFGKMTFNFDTGAYSLAPGSVAADTDVKFHYTTKDSDGDHDAAGGTDSDNANTIPGGADLVITIHNVVAPPAITSIDDNVGSIQGVVPDNGSTDDTVLVLHGTSDAGSLVKIYDGVTFLGNATSDGLGNWTFTTVALANGTDHHFNATATLGTTSAPSSNYDVTIDTTAPTVAVNIVDASQTDSNNSSVVTFIFSEVPVGFSAVDVGVVGGTVTGLTQDLGSDPSGKTWTATFNAADNFEGNATVSVLNGSYTDAVGNAGAGGSDTVPVDRVNPTVAVNIVDASLNDGDTSSEVRFVFSEVPSNFTAADITASNGTVSGLTQNLGIDPTGKTYTATFTATDGVSANGSVTVGTSWNDPVGNAAASGGSDTVSIDRSNPTVAVNIVDASLNNADPTSEVRFVFSELVSNFDASDITTTHGTISGLTQNFGVDATGKTWTATFTKEANFNGSGSVTVGTAYTDLVGNAAASGGSDTVTLVGNSNPVGGADFILTSDTGNVIIQDAWLLKNDTDAETPGSLAITDADTASGFDASDYDTVPAHSGSTVTFNLDTDTSHSVFVADGEATGIHYDLSDGNGGTADNVLATVTYESGTSLVGSANAEIIIGDADNETLTGNGGADYLIGGGGNDTLVFDAVDHLVDGGTGFDRVQTTASTFTFDNVGSDAQFANVEMVDLGDTNHNSNRTVVINVADVLDSNPVTVNVGGTNHQIDLFVIGDNGTGNTDNVDIGAGFAKIADLNGAAGGTPDTFNYTDDVTGASHTYSIYQNGNIKVAIEVGLDVV